MQPGAPAAMCTGDRKTLITHLTAEERLFLVHRDHPPENETRQELSCSNVLWLLGDTTESAAVNGNPLVTQGSSNHSEMSQLLATLKGSGTQQRSSQTPARPLVGLAGEHLSLNSCRHLDALRRLQALVRTAAGLHLLPWAVSFRQEAKLLQTACRRSPPLLLCCKCPGTLSINHALS